MDTNQNCHYFPESLVRNSAASPRLPAVLRLVERLLFWAERASQRRRLAQLDDRMLKDIGVSRVDAHRESGKWFWQD